MENQGLPVFNHPNGTCTVVENFPRIVEISDVPHVIIPEAYELRDMERTMPMPSRTRGDFRVLNATAFTRQVKLLRQPVGFTNDELHATKPAVPHFDALPIYYSRSTNSAEIQAVINASDWRDLTVTLTQRLSDQFGGEWLPLNKQPQTQKLFARFLEDRTHHVVKPEGATLLELAQKFKANTTVRYQSCIESNNGDCALEFLQTSEAGSAGAKGRMKVPERITLVMPIWHGGDPVKFEAKFSYDISTDGKLALVFEIVNLNELLSTTLQALVEKIGKEHERAVLIEGANPSVPALGRG